MKFLKTCTVTTLSAKPVEILVLKPDGSVDDAATDIAGYVGEHYVTAKILMKWGRVRLASYLKAKIPVKKMGKSGDLGEILATEYVNSGVLSYEIPIKRLRWKDTRDLPMRGEDLLGFAFDQATLKILKGEAKSGKNILNAVVVAAREALDKNFGLPLPHTLSFVVERLFEANEDKKAEQIEEYVDNRVPDRTQVAHFLFIFSGNDPSKFLMDDGKKVGKGMLHYGVNLQMPTHQELVDAVYKKVLDG